MTNRYRFVAGSALAVVVLAATMALAPAQQKGGQEVSGTQVASIHTETRRHGSPILGYKLLRQSPSAMDFEVYYDLRGVKAERLEGIGWLFENGVAFGVNKPVVLTGGGKGSFRIHIPIYPSQRYLADEIRFGIAAGHTLIAERTFPAPETER